MHHDALEFSNGKIILLARLYEGHHAIVLQLPARHSCPVHHILRPGLDRYYEWPGRIPVSRKSCPLNTTAIA